MRSEDAPAAKRAAERLAVIVDAAERAALQVIDDAEREATRYLEQARERADRLVAERLREAADEVEGGRGGPAIPLRAVDDPAPATRASGYEGAPAPEGGSAAARLLATQMAVSGSSRKEIEARLRNGFEIEDAHEILDAILGPEE
jgi:cell division septum initiation protein DivIVA